MKKIISLYENKKAVCLSILLQFFSVVLLVLSSGHALGQYLFYITLLSFAPVIFLAENIQKSLVDLVLAVAPVPLSVFVGGLFFFVFHGAFRRDVLVLNEMQSSYLLEILVSPFSLVVSLAYVIWPLLLGSLALRLFMDYQDRRVVL